MSRPLSGYTDWVKVINEPLCEIDNKLTSGVLSQNKYQTKEDKTKNMKFVRLIDIYQKNICCRENIGYKNEIGHYRICNRVSPKIAS